jgi:hypothetical protein
MHPPHVSNKTTDHQPPFLLIEIQLDERAVRPIACQTVGTASPPKQEAVKPTSTPGATRIVPRANEFNLEAFRTLPWWHGRILCELPVTGSVSFYHADSRMLRAHPTENLTCGRNCYFGVIVFVETNFITVVTRIYGTRPISYLLLGGIPLI